MNQTQMKRFRERIEEKAVAAHGRIGRNPNDKQMFYLGKKRRNTNNRLVERLTLAYCQFWRDGVHHKDQAWLTVPEKAVFDNLAFVHELAGRQIKRAEDEAIDAVVFLNEADAVKALANFEKALAKIK